MSKFIATLLDSYFLGLKGGFWFIALPIVIAYGRIKYLDRVKRQELADRLPNEELYINITSEDIYILDSLKRHYKKTELSYSKFLKEFIRGEIKNYGSY